MADTSTGDGERGRRAAAGITAVDIDDGYIGLCFLGLEYVFVRRRIGCWSWTCDAGGEKSAEGRDGSESFKEVHVCMVGKLRLMVSGFKRFT